MKIDITFSAKFRVPAFGNFVQVLHDFQTELWNYQPRALTIGYNPTYNPTGSFPDTFRLASESGGEDVTIGLTEVWQMYWYSLLKEACNNLIPESELLKRWAEITEHGRALTDNFAVQQGYADYVSGINLNAKPIRQKMLTMGGNILKVLEQTPTHYIVEAFNINLPPAEAWGKHWLINWGTQTSVNKAVTDWGQLNWNGVGYGVPFLIISDTGRAKIRKEYCTPIANDVTFNPYQ